MIRFRCRPRTRWSRRRSRKTWHGFYLGYSDLLDYGTCTMKFYAMLAINCIKFSCKVSWCNLFGPMEGKRHDCALLRESKLLEQLSAADLTRDDGTQMAVYGDPAYSQLCTVPLAEHDWPHWNGDSLRQCVEWGFGKIIQEFAFLDFKKNLNLFTACSEVLFGGGNFNQCPHLSIWQHNFELLQDGPIYIRRVLNKLETLMPAQVCSVVNDKHCLCL
jgi:hypothetical protein